jgi:uncharacterized protein YfaT (DUF1175 family)
LAIFFALAGCATHPPPKATLSPPVIYASGYDTAILTIESDTKPNVTAPDGRFRIQVGLLKQVEGRWQTTLRGGTFPGTTAVRIDTINLPLTLKADHTDKDDDGIPDALHLDSAHDQEAFRRWFTFLAETQFYSTSLPTEIDDCAALIRYAYREALRTHDSGWVRAAHLPVVLGLANVEKYAYPHTMLGASIFRTSSATYGQFADAKSLMRFNTTYISRDLARAQPGDLLFFRQDNSDMPYHSMIYLGASQIKDDGRAYILYHTGPDGSYAGEIRRPSTTELMHHQNPQWRPTTANPAFLGVYRWNIVR